jgi:hypothetical protein
MCDKTLIKTSLHVAGVIIDPALIGAGGAPGTVQKSKHGKRET